MIKILIIFLILVALATVWPILQSYFLFKKTLLLEQKISPFLRAIPGAQMRILVLGDSTAVGTGAETSDQSTAGRLGARYPKAEIVNHSENGLKIAGLNTILASMDPHQHFDIILIQIGANDIIRLTSMKNIEAGIVRILDQVKAFGGKIILLHSGNIGDSHFFPWYVRPWLSHRSYAVRALYQKIVGAYGATYVNLIDSIAGKKIESDPDRYYANDKLHLSGEGYGLWFDEIAASL